MGVKIAVGGLGVLVGIDWDWQGLIIQPLAVSTSMALDSGNPCRNGGVGAKWLLEDPFQ